MYGYEFHTVKEAEKTLGEAGITNGLIRVLTEKDCIVQETEKTLLASRKTSCGKCVFCREGLIQLEHMQKEITEGRGKNGSIDLTKEIGEAMCYSTPCSMGHVSSRIALTATDLFEDEYEAHIKKKNVRQESALHLSIFILIRHFAMVVVSALMYVRKTALKENQNIFT